MGKLGACMGRTFRGEVVFINAEGGRQRVRLSWRTAMLIQKLMLGMGGGSFAQGLIHLPQCNAYPQFEEFISTLKTQAPDISVFKVVKDEAQTCVFLVFMWAWG